MHIHESCISLTSYGTDLQGVLNCNAERVTENMYKLSVVIGTKVKILWGSQCEEIHQRSKSNMETKLLIILIKAKVKIMP
jgi:hypothetical protein